MTERTKWSLEQSGSSNVAVKSEMTTKCCESSSNTKIQNIAMACSGQEQGDGFPNDRKPTKDRSCTMQQVRLLLWVSPHSFWAPVPVSWFLPVPPGSLCFEFFVGVAPNLKIP